MQAARRYQRDRREARRRRAPARPRARETPWRYARHSSWRELRERGASLSACQIQKPRRVVVADVGAYAFVERHAVDEMSGFLGRLERIVRGEHHALVAERGDRAIEWFGGAHARRRHHDV